MRRTLTTGLFLACTLAAGAGANAEMGVSDTRILVGTSRALTGPLAFEGTQGVAGMEAYMKSVNAQGGVYGRKLEGKWYDDAYRPQDAVANMKRLIEQDGVFAVINMEGTATTKAVLPYLEENKVPLVFPFQGDSAIAGKKYVFTSYPFYDEQTRLITRWLVEKKGIKRIGIIYQDDSFGQPFLETLKKELKAMNLEMTAAESIRRGATDASVQVVKMSGANVEACLLAVTPGQGAQVLKEAAKIGWKGTKLVASGPLTDETFVSLSGGAGEGVWGLSLWPDPVHSQLPSMKKYREILAKFQPDAKPNRLTLYGYYYAALMVEGMKRAGKNLTRDGFIKAMESIKDWDIGIIQPASFSPTDHHTQYEGFMVEVKGGIFKPISGWLSLQTGKLAETPVKD